MPAQEPESYGPVEVSVVVIDDHAGNVLLDFSKSWGAFTLPMSKQRRSEQPADAAARAAAEVLGRPVDPASLAPVEGVVPKWERSLRDGKLKRYTFRVFTTQSAADPAPLPGHAAVWARRDDLRTAVPMSPTVAVILDAMPA